MPNYMNSILRVFGPKEERQRFTNYASSIVPSIYRNFHPHKEDEIIYARMNEWYYYKTWENEKGTFATFATPNTVLNKSDGFQLHKLFPQLKFIYRSIDEGYPNNCGKWEYSPNDEISETKEADLEIIQWFKEYIETMIMVQCFNRKSVDYSYICQKFAEKCDNDPAKIKRIAEMYLNDSKENGKNIGADEMDPVYANDSYFMLTNEELVNGPGIPECTKTWMAFKGCPIFNNYGSNLDNDYIPFNFFNEDDIDNEEN